MSSRSYQVFLNEVRVGWLAEADDGRIGLHIAESYRQMPARPLLSQFFEDDLERVYWGKRPGALPGFFANLMPEGRLRSLIEKSLGLPESDDLALLAAVSKDLPGALFLRKDEVPADLAAPTTEPAEAESGSRQVQGLRFSLAGVQLKFSMIREGERFTLPAHDELGEWIVKVGSNEYPGLVENEYAMMEWARRAGFDVPPCMILRGDQLSSIRDYLPPDGHALAVQRYDREGPRRIHQEDFAQVVGCAPVRKYDFTFDEMALLVRAIAGESDYEEFIRRLVFTIAIGNNDAHLKNWSLLYRDGVTPSLAPVYDQVSTIAWPQMARQTALKLAGARDFGRINLESIRRLARKAEASPERVATLVGDVLTRLRETWEEATEPVMPGTHREALRKHWQSVPLLREEGELGG